MLELQQRCYQASIIKESFVSFICIQDGSHLLISNKIKPKNTPVKSINL